MTLDMLHDMNQSQVLLYLMMVFGALLTFEGIRQLTGGPSPETKARNRRLRMIDKGVDQQKIMETLLLNAARGDTRSKSPLARFRHALGQAGVPFGPGIALLLAALLSVGLFVAASLRFDTLPAVALAVAGGFGIPYAVLDRMAEARSRKLSMQLPDALEMMARGLRVGHPMNVTLQRVARDMPDPVGSEFGLIEDRVRHGVELVDAFAEFARRIDSEDAHYLAVCVAIQHGTGGNMARVLAVLARVIRDRFNMKKKIHAISSEGRLSGVILTIMPFGIFFAIYSSSPEFFTDAMDHPIFLPAAGAVVGLTLLQAVILRRLTNFDF